MKAVLRALLAVQLTLSFCRAEFKPVLVGEWPGYLSSGFEDMALSGNYLYAVGRSGLHVIDVRDPVSPKRVGGYDPGHIANIAVSGLFAYAWVSPARGGGALVIIDIRDPIQPRMVAQLPLAFFPESIAVSRNFVFLSEPRGIHIFSVNPIIPTEVSRFPQSSGWRITSDLVISGNVACVVTSDGDNPIPQTLRIIDIVNPSQPRLVGSYVFESFADGLTIASNRVYVGTPGRLHIVDINDPTAPKLVGDGMFNRGIEGISIAGNHAYVTSYWPGGLFVLDLTDPTQPKEIAAVTNDVPIREIVARGSHAFLVGDNSSSKTLAVFDISNPASPQVVGSYSTPGTLRAVAENHAYLVGPGGLEILNVLDPARPGKMSELSTPGTAHDLAVVSNRAYVAHEGGLLVVDISDRARPTRLGTYESPQRILSVAANDTHAFIGSGSNGNGNQSTLQAIDVRDPAHPRWVGDYPAFPGAMKTLGNHLYVGAFSAGLHVIDISDPAQMTQAGHTWIGPTPSVQIGSLDVAGSYVYAGDYEVGFFVGPRSLHVIDVRDPQNPLPVGAYPAASMVSGVGILDHYALVGMRNELQAVDVRQPNALELIGSYAIPDPNVSIRNVIVVGNYAYIRNVIVAGNYAYVQDIYGRLFVFDLRELATPASPPVIESPKLDADGSFLMTIRGQPGWNYRIEASASLSSWSPVTNLPSAGERIEFKWTQSPLPQAQFFRARRE